MNKRTLSYAPHIIVCMDVWSKRTTRLLLAGHSAGHARRGNAQRRDQQTTAPVEQSTAPVTCYCNQLHTLPRRLLTNGSLRGKTWRALHAQSLGRKLCRSLRAAKRFLGPTTIPFPSSHAQTGRGIQPGCQHTHNARARDARITSCKGRLA